MGRVILTLLMGCCLGSQASERNVLRVVSMEYPALAVAARMQGEITVECTIDAEGHVVAAKVIRVSGRLANRRLSLLEEAAVENVREWQFQKANEASTAGSAHVIYRFKLETGASRKRCTRVMFELPNIMYVVTQYMPLSP